MYNGQYGGNTMRNLVSYAVPAFAVLALASCALPDGNLNSERSFSRQPISEKPTGRSQFDVGDLEPWHMRLPASDNEFDYWVTVSMINPLSSDRCLCLARDGDDLWVGTTAGAVRFSSTGPTARLFRRDEDWSINCKEAKGISKKSDYADWDARVAFFKKWAKNTVEKVVVLSPGAVWVDLYSGVMIVRNNRKQVFASTEKALAGLYATDLKSALGKVANVDRDGHLWLFRQTGEDPLGFVEIRFFDGRSWATTDRFDPYDVAMQLHDLTVDQEGIVWACGSQGIYRRIDNTWERVLEGEGFFCRLYSRTGRVLWAFGGGSIARFKDNQWEEFETQYRSEHLASPCYSRADQLVFETSDGRLWFDSFTEAASALLMGFDGERFRPAAGLQNLSATAPDRQGRVWASTGQRLWYYEKGKWEQLPLPASLKAFKITPRRGFGMFATGGETPSIKDMHFARNGTLYLATVDGLYERSKQEWSRISLAALLEPAGPGPRVPDSRDEHRRPANVVEANYKAYVAKEGKDLIEATDDQLAEDVKSGPPGVSPMISFHRLNLRDKARAEQCLESRIIADVEKAGNGEPWIIQTQLASYGPSAVGPLLKMAKSGEPESRKHAVAALALMADPDVVDELLKLVDGANKPDPNVCLHVARAAAAVGHPKGIDLLIEGATKDSKEESSGNDSIMMFREACRRDVLRFLEQQDGMPEDWSREKWNGWWKNHRDTWKLTQAKPRKDHLSERLRAGHNIYRDVARMLESGEK